MARLAPLLLVLAALSGCTVLGYVPTDAELEAILRGEDPRANEDEAAPKPKPRPPPAPPEVTGEAGPSRGTVLRWIDAATLVIEADDRRERVRLFRVTVPADPARAERALDQAMNRYTYGAAIRLRYPGRTRKGETVYRNAEGDLIATIE